MFGTVIRICVTVKVCSLYNHSTSPFLAYDDGMTRHDDHQLIRVAGVCRKFCLIEPRLSWDSTHGFFLKGEIP